MTIAYVGNFSQQHCTECHLALTLEDLGHTVIRLQENGYSSQELTNVLDQSQFDLFLFTRTWGETVTLEHLAQLRKRQIPSASYHLDLYVGLSRKYLHGAKSLAEMLQADPFWRTDFVFTPDGDPKSQAIFAENGVNHYYMKPGVFKPECYLADVIYENKVTGKQYQRVKRDVLFVGGGDRVGSPNGYGHPEWPYRDQLITWLYDTYGERFTKFGHPQETIRNKELNQLYADTKVVVGDSVCLPYGEYSHSYYWSDRVYETLGRGGFLIHPYIKGLNEEFRDGVHLRYYEYGNFKQLKYLIDYYLKHDDEREAIRRRGQEFVKQHATYNDRLTQMLDIISAAGTVPTPLPVAPIKINLGAGSEPTDTWVNVDWIAGPGIDVVHNLLEFPWPFNDSAANEILARDVLEHMPNFTANNKSTPIEFIRECWRILQPGGKLFITAPHWQSKNCWIDLSHVRGFDEKSFDYFDETTELGKAYGYYSDRKFNVSAIRTANDNVEATLTKVDKNGG